MASNITADAATPSSGDSDEYPMRHTNRGHAVIINNENFENKPSERRQGTEIDGAAMKALLLELGFQEKNIHTVDNGTQLDMMNILTEAAAKDYSNSDCFVCVIMSHGKLGSIRSSDNKDVPIDQLTAQMRKAKCPSLAGKPKIFIIQACGGKGLDRGVTIPSQHSTTQADVAGDGMPKEEPKKIEPDFIIAHSSVPGYYAWKIKERGSLFIQSLVDVILNNWRQEDLLSMLTEVNNTVAKDEEFIGRGLMQMPFVHCQLTKKVFFHTH